MAKVNVSAKRCKRCGIVVPSVLPDGLCGKCEQKWTAISDTNNQRYGQVVAK